MLYPLKGELSYAGRSLLVGMQVPPYLAIAIGMRISILHISCFWDKAIAPPTLGADKAQIQQSQGWWTLDINFFDICRDKPASRELSDK